MYICRNARVTVFTQTAMRLLTKLNPYEKRAAVDPYPVLMVSYKTFEICYLSKRCTLRLHA